MIAFGSYGDVAPFHGWILAYNKTTLQPTGVFNDTPNGSDGGIWNSGSPIQVDSQGFLYTETGNGTFDTTHNRAGLPSRGDYGDTVLKSLIPGYQGPNGTGFKVVDYFMPSNQAKLEKNDGDLASSDVLILPDGMGGPKHPNLLLASGKSGTVYVINRNDLGHYDRATNHIVQTLPNLIGGSYDTPAIFNNTIYYAACRRSREVVHDQERPSGANRAVHQHTSLARCQPCDLVRRHNERHRLGGFRLGRADRVRRHEFEQDLVASSPARLLTFRHSNDHERRSRLRGRRQ